MSANRQIPFTAIILLMLAVLAPLHALPIKFLPWDDAIAARKIGFSDGKDVAEIQNLHPDKRTRTLVWAGGEIPPVLVALDRTSPDGKPVTVPVRIRPGMKSPLVLILPDPAAPSGLRCYVLEDHSESFGWGTLRFINATGQELLVRNDQQIKALPQSWQPLDIQPGGSKRNIAIQMAAKTDLNTILFSSVWEHDPDIRKLIIVVPGTEAQSAGVDLKIIPEDRRAAAPVTPPTSVQTP
ncbi:MAG: hypothetical protein WEB53_08875 [Akkermansiaceae bacterium]